MKKLILLGVLMGVALLNMQGQDYSYKRSSCKGMKKSCLSAKVALAFDSNSDIMRVSDSETGTEKYIRKSVCPFSATVQYEDVVFNPSTGGFVSQEVDHSKYLGINKKDCSIECLMMVSDNSTSVIKQVPKT
jgi:hypothetical protein